MTRETFLDKLAEQLGWYGADRGIFCHREDCFYVKDTFGGVTARDRPVRSIYIYGFYTVAVSQAILNIPTLYNDGNLDTSKWSINKSFVQPIGYMFPTVSGIFASRALPNDETTNGNVLFIGLGGGTLNNLLTAGFPNINVTSVDNNPVMKRLAVELFDNVENEKNHIVIGDGVEFMKNETKRGAQYDAIIGDVCYNNGDKPNICPIDLFLNDDVIEIYKKLLKPTGFLAHNVVAKGEIEMQDEIIQNILKLHMKHFGEENCVMHKCHSIRNFVLMCRSIGFPSKDDYRRVEEAFADRFEYTIVENEQ
ncbi:unnamed protein product, partial [Mesorhabditis belari]|uniref:Uncharacterized protein n=1 Tax=Mesorhabditis belari TaxID=2138241 RepID=A0AAF3EJN8_9BILA